jgi:hypothetical protein
MMADTISNDELEARAASIGRQHGINAASWVFDGNTTEETYRTVLRGIEDDDPAVYDMFREPNLSGEFAGDYSIRDLQSDLDIEIDWTRDGTQEASEQLDECANAYADAASETFWHEIERLAREHVIKARAETLRSVGFPILHAYRPDEGQDWIAWHDRSDYPRDDTEPYADLSAVGKGEDYYDQSSTLDRSNHRRLREDYPGTFTVTSYANVDALGAFVADLSDKLAETLIALREQHPVYDEEDMSALETEEITEQWQDFASDELGEELPPDVSAAWSALTKDERWRLFGEACDAAGYYSEHSGIEVLWSYAYERTAGIIAERIRHEQA